MSKDKKKIVDILGDSIPKTSLSTHSMLTAIVDRFLPSPIKLPLFKKYSELSSTQKEILHAKVKQSITDSFSSYGRLKVKKSDKENLNIAYDFMVQVAELAAAKIIPLNVAIIVELQRLAMPKYAGLRIPTKGPGLATSDGAVFTPAAQIEILLKNLVYFINNPPPEVNRLLIELIARSIFISMHPFNDGNGRTNMLLGIYIDILYDICPQIFSDVHHQTEMVMFSEFVDDILKNIDAIFASSNFKIYSLTPAHLTPSGMRVLRKIRPNLPNSWMFNGKDLDYAQLQVTIAKNIIGSVVTNHKNGVKAISHLQNSQPPSLNQTDFALNNFLNYLLDHYKIISLPLLESLSVSITQKFGVEESCKKLSIKKLIEIIKTDLAELINKKLPAYQLTPSKKNLQELENFLNYLEKVYPVMTTCLEYSQQPEDIYELSTLLSTLKSVLTDLELEQSFTTRFPILSKVKLLIQDLISSTQGFNIRHSYTGPFMISPRELKTCPWDLLPQGREFEQINSAGPKTMPWGGFSLLAAATVTSGGVAEIMLVVLAVYMLARLMLRLTPTFTASRLSTCPVTIFPNSSPTPSSSQQATELPSQLSKSA